MGRNTNGVFTRVHNWTTDKTNSVKITASRFDAENNDFASALTASGEIAKLITGSYNALTVVETTAQNSISATPHTAITSYTTNEQHWWLPKFNNTGAATLTISGLAAKALKAGGAALGSGMILSGVPVMIICDGSEQHVMNPQRSPSNFVNTVGYQDNSITLAKWSHETVQGAMVYTGAAGTPSYLAPGTSGQALISGGASANLSWGAVAVVSDTSPQLGGFLDANGNYIQMQKGGDIASESPTVIDTDGDYFICTGTTGFSAFTVAADRHFFLEFAAVLTMTHGAGTLDLPSGANITTAAGDVGEFVSTASNVVTCVNYSTASGKALVESVTLANSVTLTNKTLGAVTLGGAVTGGDQTISAINLKDYGEVTNALGDLGGGTDAINLTLGNSVSATVSTGTQTFTFTNPTASDELCAFSLMLTNGGSQTVNWPSTVDFAGAAAPALTASGVDCLVFWTIDGGTIWNGSTVALNLS